MATMTIYAYAVKPKADDIVLQHLHALNDGNIQEAYDLTATAFKRNTRYEGFKRFIEANSALTAIEDIEILHQVQHNHDAQISGYIECVHGHHIPFEILLTTELGDWKIINIEIDSTKHAKEIL